jgi:hypothetical protein
MERMKSMDPQCGQEEMAPRQRSLSERLLSERARLRARLADIEAVVTALDANPESQRLLDALNKLGHV